MAQLQLNLFRENVSVILNISNNGRVSLLLIETKGICSVQKSNTEIVKTNGGYCVVGINYGRESAQLVWDL